MGFDEPEAPDEIADDQSDPDAHPNWFLRRFAGVIGDTYRTMDPDVARMITSPGVLPAPDDAER